MPGRAATRCVRSIPDGKVPVLIADGVTLTDSTAIMAIPRRPARAVHPYPCGTTDRARQDGFTQFINDELDAVLWTAARHSFVLPEDKRVRGGRRTR